MSAKVTAELTIPFIKARPEYGERPHARGLALPPMVERVDSGEFQDPPPPWNSGQVYDVGYHVSYQGSNYTSVQSSNSGHEPGTDANWWALKENEYDWQSTEILPPEIESLMLDDRYETIALTVGFITPVHVEIDENNRVIQTKSGTIELRLDYAGSNRPSFIFIGGGSPPPSVTDLGQREETHHTAIQFRGESTQTIPSGFVSGTPRILNATKFYGQYPATAAQANAWPGFSEGDLYWKGADTPRVRGEGDAVEIFANRPVWGSLMLEYTTAYRLYRLTYNVSDLASGGLERLMDIPSMTISMVAGLAVATAQASRTVKFPAPPEIYSSVIKEEVLQEYAQRGFIYRVFPPTVPDEVTGTTNYYDVKVVTEKVSVYLPLDAMDRPIVRRDPYGKLVSATRWVKERYTGREPPNSRMIEPFEELTELSVTR